MSIGSVRGESLAPPARRPILRSWERCAGMSSDAADDPQGLRRGELQDRMALHHGLLQAAAPEIDTLANLVASASSLVLLADAGGVILQCSGNTSFLQRADQVALRPGVSWAEGERGTNAIGTVLVEASPLRVHGREHFLARNQILSCHAAPIHAPRGDLLGVLDISGDAQHLHPYALGLATLGARQVANRLLVPASARQTQLVFHRHAALLDSAERGILVIEDEHIVGANAAAVALLGTDWKSLIDQPVRDWLGAWEQLTDQSRAVRSAGGESFHAALQQPARRRPVSSPAARAAAPVVSPSGVTVRAPQPAADVQPLLASAVRALDAGLGVLLQGETGAGKEVFARALHGASQWRSGPFVAVNCGALPESLIEAELFGYAPGAYTGARRDGSRGLLREADGGLLFLDEIGDMPLSLQTRLLRALQERQVQPLGGGKPVAVSFGLVSATHRDLPRLMADGSFRADLFYRLQDLAVSLPALRARSDLAAFVAAELTALTPPGAPALHLDPYALAQLTAYDWPGNYRQLHSVLRTLAVFHPDGGVVTAAALPSLSSQGHAPLTVPASRAAPSAAPLQTSLRSVSDLHIAEAIARHRGSLSAAARELGVHRSTLYRWNTRHRPRPGGAGQHCTEPH